MGCAVASSFQAGLTLANEATARMTQFLRLRKTERTARALFEPECVLPQARNVLGRPLLV